MGHSGHLYCLDGGGGLSVVGGLVGGAGKEFVLARGFFKDEDDAVGVGVGVGLTVLILADDDLLE